MPKKILIADNDPLLRAALREGLEGRGFQVSEAEDGHEAWQAIQHGSPDYLVLDPVMPNLEGARLCGTLKADPRFRVLPIFVLTGAGPEAARDSEDLGADACIVKRSAGETVANFLRAFDAFEAGKRPALPEHIPGLAEFRPRQIVLELLAQTSHLTAVLQNLGDGILLLDLAGRILYANPAGLEIFQRPELELLGAEIATLVRGSAGDALQQALHTLASQGGGATLRLDASYRDRTLQLTVTNLLESGRIVGHLLLIRDATSDYQRIRELTTLNELGVLFTSSLDLQALLQRVMEHIRACMQVEAGSLLLKDPGADILVFRTAMGAHRESIEGRHLMVGQGIAGWVFREGVPAIVPDAQKDPRFWPGLDDAIGFTTRSMLCAPLRVHGKIIGVIQVMNSLTSRPLGEQDLKLLCAIAAQAAVAIENARLYETSQRALAEQTQAGETLTRYQLLADHARDIVLFVRRNGRILEANRAAVAAYGYSPEALLTLTIQDLRAPETHSLTAQQMALEDTDGILFETAHRRKDGSIFPVEVSSRGATLGGERVLLSIIRDITARKQAEAALAERTQQLEAVRAVTIEITQELNLTALLALIVRRAVDLLGAGGGATFLWDETARVLLPQAWSRDQEWVSQLRFKLGEGLVGTVAERRAGLIVNNYRHWPAASPLVLAHNRATAALAEPLLYHDRLMGVIVVSNEGTARTFGEEDRKALGPFAAQAAIAIENANLYTAVRRDAATLAARVQDRTQELMAARRQAETASEAKSEFLAGLSHELRAPLHYIIGFSDLLTMEGYDPLTERQARFLGHIQKSSKHLLQLISDILDLGKIEAGKIDLAPQALPVAQTLEEILTVCRELANKKAQEFRADISPDLPPLTADPLRFKQILVNLLNNAVKFTPEQGQIVLTARRVPTCTEGPEPEGGEGRAENGEPGPWLEIQVTDTGIGIESVDLPRLFQKFIQLEPRTARRHGGVGLGLAITKKLVELHGGRIWAQSEGEGRGSTFTIRLPYGGPGAPPEDD